MHLKIKCGLWNTFITCVFCLELGLVIRVDGRGFSSFTESRFDKPFDLKFHELMVQTTKVLLEELQGIYAYTESDEISILCPPQWNFFDRSLEKIVSI